MENKTSIGKILGSIAFVIAEIIAVLLLFAVMHNFYLGNGLDLELISNLTTYQGSILGITWVSKASSNFAKNK